MVVKVLHAHFIMTQDHVPQTLGLHSCLNFFKQRNILIDRIGHGLLRVLYRTGIEHIVVWSCIGHRDRCMARHPSNVLNIRFGLGKHQ